MTLDNDVRDYIDGKFEELYRRIDENKKDTFIAIGNINKDMTQLQINQMNCAQIKSQEITNRVERHEREKHNPTKTLGILVAIIALINGGVFLLSKLIK